uniref:Metal transporter CNNM n=1 Tax=Tetraselmis sp. GSL018 TaxID=582737 RepID=A0A061QYX0_9CHLO|mmetsp:Transcript_22822/g.54616  ORF Transcript_22822/g.54616 Transcript_22822/m.54616 type:complete len:698 (-) Transcript_22822:205-2298(-)
MTSSQDPEPDGTGWPLWANLTLAAVIVCFSALFSGLTLGLMSLDKHGLEILMKGGDTKERHYASLIYPLRCRGNLLLCTLLIGNTIVNSFLSILLASLTSGTLGLLVSTSMIVIFGEIVPQSICTRFGLLIGAKTRHVTLFFMIILYPLAWPISKVLDLVLGREVGMSYDKEELKELIRIHVENPDAQMECGLTADDGAILHGALEYRDKKVSDVMTPLERVFMLEASLCLDYNIMLQIYKSGYTRIPVYEGDRNNIIGLLYTKDLILIDPADKIQLRTLVALRGSSNVKYVMDSTPLGECFKTFKGSFIHMLVAVSLRRQGSNAAVNFSSCDSNALLQADRVVSGVITLEDVLEEVIQAEIVDESDIYMNNTMKTRILSNRHNMDVTAFLGLIHNRYRSITPQLTEQEISAVVSFLLSCVSEFSPFVSSRDALWKLVKESEVLAINASSASLPDALLNGAPDPCHQPVGPKDPRSVRRQRWGAPHRPEDLNYSTGRVLFRAGVAADYFLVILQGKVIIRAGEEEFESAIGPWNTLGQKALVSQKYVPDYTAVGVENLVVLKVLARDYQSALPQTIHAVRNWCANSPLNGAVEVDELQTDILSRGSSRRLICDADIKSDELLPEPMANPNGSKSTEEISTCSEREHQADTAEEFQRADSIRRHNEDRVRSNFSVCDSDLSGTSPEAQQSSLQHLGPL